MTDKRIGNQFWKARAKHGRSKIFSSPNQLWKAAIEYFEWSDENPLLEQKAFAYQGVITKTEITKMRAYTITGLCIFLGVTRNYLTDLKDRLNLDTRQGKDFSRIIKMIEEIIFTQKFEGAAADLLNANIIARDLGLTDKKDIDHKSTDGSMAPDGLTTEERQERIQALLSKKK